MTNCFDKGDSTNNFQLTMKNSKRRTISVKIKTPASAFN